MRGSQCMILLLVGASLQTVSAQELTPDQRRFMGLPEQAAPRPVEAPASPAARTRGTVQSQELATPPDTISGPPMTFRSVGEGSGRCCNWVAADGIITTATPEAFRTFLATIGRAESATQQRIVLNSPGGDFFAGLALGREIRRSTRMWTAVGRSDVDAARGDGRATAYRVTSGVCLSACVLAFMGGKTREYQQQIGSQGQILALQHFAIDKPSELIGTSSSEAMANAGLPTEGLLRLTLEGYFIEMGIEPALISAFYSAGQPDGAHVIGQAEADQAGLNTPTDAQAKWRLSPAAGGLALDGSGSDRWTNFVIDMRCLVSDRQSIEYSIAVPVEQVKLGTEGAQIDYAGYVRAASIVDTSDNASNPLPFAVSYDDGRILAKATLGPAQIELVRRGHARIEFDTTQSYGFILPQVHLASPQIAEDVDMLLKNCPN